MSYRGRAKVAERVCKHTRTHSGFCSPTLTQTLPPGDERRFYASASE